MKPWEWAAVAMAVVVVVWLGLMWANSVRHCKVMRRLHEGFAREWDRTAQWWRDDPLPDDATERSAQRCDRMAMTNRSEAEQYRKMLRIITLGIGGRR